MLTCSTDMIMDEQTNADGIYIVTLTNTQYANVYTGLSHTGLGHAGLGHTQYANVYTQNKI